jgi:DNA-directed RNA polymerase subunit RPC12/RpoP
MVEPCANCGRETPHSVTVELWTESADGENASFSREPYRVSECQTCGEEFVQRMSNA